MSSYLYPEEDTVELEAQAILSKRRMISAPNADRVDSITDDDWLKQSFMIDPKQEFEELNMTLRTYTSAEFKFQDSSLGGSHEVNPRPQFTRYADIRVKGKLRERKDTSINSADGNHGMGHYYSEAIHDTSQVIHMRFGVPQFNSLTTFFTGFFSYRAARVARTGRSDTSIFEDAGKAVGLVSLFIAWPLLLLSITGGAIRFLLGKPSTAYYYLKPTMPVYWYAVNTMVNQIGVNRGLYSAKLDKYTDTVPGDYKKMDTDAMQGLARLLPDVFSDNGGIDVYAAANRAKRIKNRLELILAQMLIENPTSFHGLVSSYGDRAKAGVIDGLTHSTGIQEAVKRWFMSDYGKIVDNGTKETYASEKAAIQIGEDGKASNTPTIKEHLAAEFDDGSEFASFRVDSTGAISESFSNNFVENDMSSKFNSISSASKASYFAFAGYNISTLVDPAINAVKSFAAGALDAVHMSGLLALNGSAFVDIPKNWENSSVNFPKSNYTMTLISPYGNTISQMTNIYIPLCMLLAGALPIQTGKHSYSSPFILELYDKGRQQTRLGMIDSLSIQRGTSNLGFNKQGLAMAIEVSFSVVDLSSVLAMPIIERGILDEANVFESLFDDDSTFSDYMNILSSVDLGQQIYKSSKFQQRWQQKLRRISQIFSPARIAGIVHNFPPVGVLDVFFKGTDRL